MDNLNIGKIITEPASRDAIHVAVAPVTAGERLSPGQHVGVTGGTASGLGPFVGIVDPFLPGAVEAEQRFWLCLYPGSITSLRHHWSHPAMPDAGTPGAVAVGPEETALDRLFKEVQGLKDTLATEVREAVAKATGEAESFSCPC